MVTPVLMMTFNKVLFISISKCQIYFPFKNTVALFVVMSLMKSIPIREQYFDIWIYFYPLLTWFFFTNNPRWYVLYGTQDFLPCICELHITKQVEMSDFLTAMLAGAVLQTTLLDSRIQGLLKNLLEMHWIGSNWIR